MLEMTWSDESERKWLVVHITCKKPFLIKRKELIRYGVNCNRTGVWKDGERVIYTDEYGRVTGHCGILAKCNNS
jgi:hypothetical protein